MLPEDSSPKLLAQLLKPDGAKKQREPSQDLDNLARKVIGAAIEVHRSLGPGFLESVYEEALCVELGLRHIPFARQVAVSVTYKGVPVGVSRLDILVNGQLIVELKSAEALLPIHSAQVLSYLKATNSQLVSPGG